MTIWSQALIVLLIVWVLARLIKRRTPLLQRYFIPSSIIGGILLLLIGPQLMQIIPGPMTSYLSSMPALLINIVFAGLFIGRAIPGIRKIWDQSGPMIAYGNTTAWGMYVLGIALVLTVLGPVFGAPNIFGSLLEISFTGGHGTAAGLAPVFRELGSPGGTTLALGLATFSIVTSVIVGIIIINIYNRRTGRLLDRATMKYQQNQMIKNGYSLTKFTHRLETNPREIITAISLLAMAIGVGWLILHGLVWSENSLLDGVTDFRVFGHLPLFPLAMFGGLIVQIILKRLHLSNLVNLNTIQVICSIALDLLIVTAIGTMSLNVIAHNFATFSILAITGALWVIFMLLFVAPKMFRKHWFEYGMTDFGQAMGTTATGLLMNRLVDPMNRTGAREAFAYKQLAFEAFMGGGIFTAVSAVLIVEWGIIQFFILAIAMFCFWLTVGLILGAKRSRRRNRRTLLGSLSLRL